MNQVQLTKLFPNASKSFLDLNLEASLGYGVKGRSVVAVEPKWKSGWRTIGHVHKYFRSRWEANYARFLEFQREHGFILAWDHEPTTFWFDGVKRGCVSYLPDFEVKTMSGAVEYHEVKGWMDPKSKTKLKRMAKYFPGVKMVLKDEAWFKSNRTLRNIVPGWE